jgi:poly-gamma-glutamate capsule biosynthesis protein CapA/YwtB (metallophosphatase superfamily)
MKDSTVKLLVTGDFCPHNRIQDLVLKSDYQSVFNDFIDIFQENDLNVTDLECPLTSHRIRRMKTGPHQKAEPICVELLKYANIRLATLANNHIMDYGSTGAKDTIELCHRNDIQTVGAGEGIEYARKPYIASIRGKQIAFINVADQEFLTDTDGSFQANPVDPLNTYYDLVSSRNKYDYVILIIHGGNEFYHLPSPRIKKLYRFFIDVGADAVISHHTHCFSGYEIYKGKPIFYGLGNFIYDWPGRTNSDWNKGYVVRLTCSDEIQFDIIPLKQSNIIPGVFHLNTKEEIEFKHKLEERNQIISDDIKLDQAFNQYVKNVTPMYDSFIEPYFGRFLNALRQRRFLPDLMNKKKRLLLLNLVRCEAHREILLQMLAKNQQG